MQTNLNAAKGMDSLKTKTKISENQIKERRRQLFGKGIQDMKKMIDSSLAKLDKLGILSKAKVFKRAPHKAKAEGGEIKASKTKLRS